MFVYPGFIETDMTAGLSAAKRDAVVKLTPLQQLGQPHDVAELVCFLTQHRYITGQVTKHF